jgi:hypothetical protein
MIISANAANAYMAVDVVWVSNLSVNGRLQLFCCSARYVFLLSGWYHSGKNKIPAFFTLSVQYDRP